MQTQPLFQQEFFHLQQNLLYACQLKYLRKKLSIASLFQIKDPISKALFPMTFDK